MKKILIVAATMLEIQPFYEQIKVNFEQVENEVFERDGVQIRILVTGVGMLLTGVHLMRFLVRGNVDWVINAGIAGAFDEGLDIGEVIEVGEEQFGDLGAQERGGGFVDIFDMQLMDGNVFPFEKGILRNKNVHHSLSLKRVKGLTVNKVHGEADAIHFIKEKYKADIETMEGAAFFYVCQFQKIPFTQIRSISNYVEPRNRANWNIPVAVKHLNEVLWQLIES